MLCCVVCVALCCIALYCSVLCCGWCVWTYSSIVCVVLWVVCVWTYSTGKCCIVLWFTMLRCGIVLIVLHCVGLLYRVVLCCDAVCYLCCVVLCCAVLCCVVLCYVVLCCVVLRCVALCGVVLDCALCEHILNHAKSTPAQNTHDITCQQMRQTRDQGCQKKGGQ